jgi:Na+-translocating ferredoxin:NAD+ oxidoreductase subunit B
MNIKFPFFFLWTIIKPSYSLRETMNPYQQLALALDALPNGFPPTPDGAELRLLEKLYTPEEAALTAQLSPRLESSDQIAARLGLPHADLRKMLKSLAKRGLIEAGRTETGLGYALLPFVVGIYEYQAASLDAELAQLFEAYFQHGFHRALEIKPQVHRVIPIGESVKNNMEIRPYESAAGLVDSMQAWGVIDCICRKQKALIGEPCEHPLDVCMMLSDHAGAFDASPVIRTLSREEAHATLRRAAQAGLVHSVSNNQNGLHYICNCCTCSCGILRGMAELGIANVVASSAFVLQVDENLCETCGACIETCAFEALSMGMSVEVNQTRCVGCGVCVQSCPSEALGLVRRPEEQIKPIPETIDDWRLQRDESRRAGPQSP